MLADSFGITGMVLDYTTIVFFMASALVFLVYYWKKGLIDFGEDVKYSILKDDDCV